ncbi:MAG TPA: aminotransferase class III-fold pyridoxal phosphate-dependent enzyme, partial [Burkholderiales bacterium]|nr:aminotransferase class III-fold pyridoxal phosphate-dependent enzyme [Burkholderiales bacterium]
MSHDFMSGAQLAERAVAVFPGGSLGESSLPPEMVIVLARGKGARVWDASGKAHIDFTMGWGSVLLGHANPAVTTAVVRQAPLGSNFSYVNEPAVELAEELVRAVPCADRVRFCASGTEATLYAAALARAFTQRPKILKFEGAYHGAHDLGTYSLYPRRLLDFPHGEPMSAAVSLGV